MNAKAAPDHAGLLMAARGMAEAEIEKVREIAPAAVVNLTSVFVIMENRHGYDRDGYECVDEEVDLDRGFFVSRDKAEKLVDDLNAPRLQPYEEAMAAYPRQVKRWEAKSSRAAKQGFRNPDDYPRKPEAPDLYEVVEIQAARP